MVAVIALLLQIVGLASRPIPRVATDHPDLRVSYGEPPNVSIPRLQESFLVERLGDVDAAHDRAVVESPRKKDRAADPSPAPDKDDGRTSVTPPTLPAPRFSLMPTMRVQPGTARPGDEITYEIVLANDGTASYTGTVTYSTHVPLWSARCVAGACVVPGVYDGTSTDPDDLHVDPITAPLTVSIEPQTEEVVATLAVRALALAPSGVVLHDHAHVDVTGDDEETRTILAPDVSISRSR